MTGSLSMRAYMESKARINCIILHERYLSTFEDSLVLENTHDS